MTAFEKAASRPTRDAAAVGVLDELPVSEAAAVLYFRMWSSDGESRSRVRADFRLFLGDERGDHAAKMLDDLIYVLNRHGRRPMVRHGHGCRCLGGDEAAFANLVAASVEGDRNDAALIASLFVGGEMSFRAVALAQEFGAALAAMTPLMTRNLDAARSRRPSAATLH